jgi:UDP-N-acetylmuramate--alanine ligase
MDFQLQSYNHFFFIGIAGTGMSAIAQYLNGVGKQVSGSDRLFGSDSKNEIERQFESMGIRCYFQDGLGIIDKTEVIVISTAIEESNIELQKARKLGLTVVKRSELLAAISSEKKTIAVGGTSGKSTTTAMIFHILESNGYSPSLMTGAGLSSLQEKGLPGNAWVGESDWLVIESDESDGSIVNYKPEIAVVLNIDRDHKEFDELMLLFQTFKNNTRGTFIVNQDYKLTQSLSQNSMQDFGTSGDAGFLGSHFSQIGFSILFTCKYINFTVPVIGRHNMENTLAAVAVCASVGVSVSDSAKAMTTFRGIYRRTQLIGEKDGICVIDDFAHNPSEVAAAIKACQAVGKRVHAWFQPHGYGPLRFMHQDLIHEVSAVMRKEDFFYVSDVYYAGGTVAMDIQSDILIEPMIAKGVNAYYIAERKKLVATIKKDLRKDDVILIMGARDTTLSTFAMLTFIELVG